MSKYQVKFARQRQIDGWTDPANDLEYDTVSETITVEAKNKKQAVKVACKKAYGWVTYTYPRRVEWNEEDVKSIKRK
jgi:hypothetical protein